MSRSPSGAVVAERGSARWLPFAVVGLTLFSGGTAGVFWLLGGVELATLRGHAGVVRAVVFSPDGMTLASAGDDGRICLWDTVTNRRKTLLNGSPRAIFSLTFTPDGASLASTGADGTVHFWDLATATESDSISVSKRRLWSVAISPDGTTLAAAGDDKLIHLWRLPSRQPLAALRGHTKHVHAVAFLGDRKTLASGGGEGGVRLWDWSAGKQTGQFAAEGHVQTLNCSREGRMLAAAGSGLGARWWTLASRQAISPAVSPGSSAGVALHPEGTIVCTTHDDGLVKLWKTEDGTFVAAFPGHRGPVLAAAFAPDGKTLATAGADGTVKRWATPER